MYVQYFFPRTTTTFGGIKYRLKELKGFHVPMFSFDRASSEQTLSKEHFKIAILGKEFDRFSFKRSIMYI